MSVRALMWVSMHVTNVEGDQGEGGREGERERETGGRRGGALLPVQPSLALAQSIKAPALL